MTNQSTCRYLASIVALTCLLAPAALAAEPDASPEEIFKSRQGVIDKVESAGVAEPKVLSGQVTHHKRLEEQSSEQVQTAPDLDLQDAADDAAADASINVQDLQKAVQLLQGHRQARVFTSFFGAAIKTNGDTRTFTFTGRKPSHSPDYFRKLNYGVIGLKMVSYANVRLPIVTEVYPTCPAALAGIRPGDLLYEAQSYRFKNTDDQSVLWRVVGGKADTPVDVTVVRNGTKLVFHLNRMNIEDIADNHIRLSYELLLSAYGGPGE